MLVFLNTTATNNVFWVTVL